MFDFLRNLTKSASEKRRERLTAYLDGELDAADQARFEAEMAADEALRSEVSALRQVKSALSRLPRVAVPRNFILDPAQFQARPRPARRAVLYPAMRAATALAAFFFVVLLSATILQTTASRATFSAPEGETAQTQNNAAADTVEEAGAAPQDEAQLATAPEVVTEALAEAEMTDTTTESARIEAPEEETAEEEDAGAAETFTADEAPLDDDADAAADAAAGDSATPPPVAGGTVSDGAGNNGADGAEPEATATLMATTAPTATATPAPPRPVATSTTLPRAGEPHTATPTVTADTDLAMTESAAPFQYDLNTPIETPVPEGDPPAPANTWLLLTMLSGGLLVILAGITLYLRRRL